MKNIKERMVLGLCSTVVSLTLLIVAVSLWNAHTTAKIAEESAHAIGVYDDIGKGTKRYGLFPIEGKMYLLDGYYEKYLAEHEENAKHVRRLPDLYVAYIKETPGLSIFGIPASFIMLAIFPKINVARHVWLPADAYTYAVSLATALVYAVVMVCWWRWARKTFRMIEEQRSSHPESISARTVQQLGESKKFRWRHFAFLAAFIAFYLVIKPFGIRFPMKPLAIGLILMMVLEAVRQILECRKDIRDNLYVSGQRRKRRRQDRLKRFQRTWLGKIVSQTRIGKRIFHQGPKPLPKTKLFRWIRARRMG